MAPSPSAPVGAAQPHESPAPTLQSEPRPLSNYDDNPVRNEVGTAFIAGVSPDTLKKGRQRNQGPDYIQYGLNGVVRYELKAHLEFRDRHRVRSENKNHSPLSPA